jgi:hypothetical protein
MQTYSIYIEFTNDTYSVIKCKCDNESHAEKRAIEYAEIMERDIYFIEVEPINAINPFTYKESV